MRIKVLGPGCVRCHQVEAVVREALSELGVEATVGLVSDLRGIMRYPIGATPALVINEKLVMWGQVPSKPRVVQWIINALQEEEGGASHP